MFILRIALASDTKRLLCDTSRARKVGRKKDAALPFPSTRPELPDPARVVTAPKASIIRILKLPVSAMYKTAPPELSSPATIPWGLEKLALTLSVEFEKPGWPEPA